jgi:Ca2+-transporting ATPase
VFEAEQEEDDVMQRGPRPNDASVFDPRILFKGALQGIALLASVVVSFALALRQGLDSEQARALAFSVMVLGNIGLIFINRSLSPNLLKSITLPNPTLWWVVISALLILGAGLFLPSLSALFYFGNPAPLHIAISAGAASLFIAVIALVKSRGYLRMSESPH